MSDLRRSNGLERNALKSAFAHALKLLGGAASFAHATRVNTTTLSNYHNPHMPEAHAAVDVVLDLEREIGSPVITSKLAELQGYRLIHVGPGEPSSVTAEDTYLMLQHTVDACKATTLAIADGVITPAEGQDVDRKCEAAVAAIRDVQARMPADWKRKGK